MQTGSKKTGALEISPDKKRKLIDRALIKKAVGYTTKEVVEEFGEEDGEMVLKKKKVTSKSVPPDVTALKILFDKEEEKPLLDMTDEQLEKEKIRLLKLLEELNKQ